MHTYPFIAVQAIDIITYPNFSIINVSSHRSYNSLDNWSKWTDPLHSRIAKTLNHFNNYTFPPFTMWVEQNSFSFPKKLSNRTVRVKQKSRGLNGEHWKALCKSAVNITLSLSLSLPLAVLLTAVISPRPSSHIHEPTNLPNLKTHRELLHFIWSSLKLTRHNDMRWGEDASCKLK